ncbi:hypothetical protein TKK_0011652 [Trichogramma kaykai]
MTLTTFDYILSKIEGRLQKNWCNLHPYPILPEERLVLTIRYLATGLSFTQLSLLFLMGISTVKSIIEETLTTLWDILSLIHMSAPSHDKFLQISKEFYNKWGMPHCLGAIDVYQAVVDANYRYIFIDVGAYGSQSDGGVYKKSELKQALDHNFLDIPSINDQSNQANQEIQVPYFFVGDGAYPLSNNIMKPFPGEKLTRKQLLFNQKLSRARAVVENAFGHTCQRWEIFYTPIKTLPKTVIKIIKGACILHNIIIDKEGSEPLTLSSEDEYMFRENALYRETDVADDDVSGKEIRDSLVEYFSKK